MKNPNLSAKQQKRKLAGLLLVFMFVLSIPIYYLLKTVYSQLETEAYFNTRQQAETLTNQIERHLQNLLEVEQKRPIAEYQFFNVMENPLLSETAGIKFSPLSEIPPKTDIKGLIGYFQINTDGSFHLPALPELGQDNISGLSLAELETRLQLKQKIRNLLSIKATPEKREANKKDIALTKKNVPEYIAKQQPYIKEFKQSNRVLSSNPTSLVKELELSSVDNSSLFDDNSIPQKARKIAASRKLSKKLKTRKEIVQLPDQAMASSYFKKSKSNIASVNRQQESLNIESIDTIETAQINESIIQVLSFESEVTPLQLLLIGEKYFCFYRYIWHDNNRYTQGFIVDSHIFLQAVTQPFLKSVLFSDLIFKSKAQFKLLIQTIKTNKKYQLYHRNLAAPLQNIQLTINASKLAHVPGSLLINVLAISLISIFTIGFIVFYRLISQQIDLAKQQINFISAVSHELKTPLTSIRMYAEMLRAGWVSDDHKKHSYYDFIFYESERLSRLIANVLQLARFGSKKQKPEIITISPQSLLKLIPSIVEAQIQASSFKLNCVQANKILDHVDIEIDKDAFSQVIINLVDNAIKFSKLTDNKTIDIGFILSKNKKDVHFFIRDYGLGIKKNQLKKVFQLFYRSEDELTRTTPGTGIGLALVAQLADMMNAKVEVLNRQPGAEFQIIMPIK